MSRFSSTSVIKVSYYQNIKGICTVYMYTGSYISGHFIFFYFSEKISLDISCESSALLMIHMKCQSLIISENLY